MSTTAAPLTVEQFLALPEDDTVRQELIGGELISMARDGQLHEIVKSNFGQELGAYFEQNPIGRVMSETTFRLSDHDSPMPDVSVVLSGRLQPGHTGLIPVSPDIAIEVVSSETAKALQAKTKLFLRHGTTAVWVAYPELRIVQVYDGRGVRELSGEDVLEAPEVIPGFRAPVSVFFADL